MIDLCRTAMERGVARGAAFVGFLFHCSAQKPVCRETQNQRALTNDLTSTVLQIIFQGAKTCTAPMADRVTSYRSQLQALFARIAEAQDERVAVLLLHNDMHATPSIEGDAKVLFLSRSTRESLVALAWSIVVALTSTLDKNGRPNRHLRDAHFWANYTLNKV